MKGFTLIELIVTVAIALVVTGGVVVNYNNYNVTQTVKQAALTLKNDLRFAQSKAAAGEKPTSGCTELLGWTVKFYASLYTMEPECTEGLVGLSTQTLTTVQFPAGVSFASIPFPIRFDVLTRGATLGGSGLITLVRLGRMYFLEVSPSGDISDLGLQ